MQVTVLWEIVILLYISSAYIKHCCIITGDRFIEDLEEGIFIQQTLDTVVFDNDGKQLLVSANYWAHVMLVHAPTLIEREPIPVWSDVTDN